MDRENAFKACPFCGDEYNVDVEKRFDGDFFVECGNMDCEVQPITNDFPTKNEAIEAWNTRALTEAPKVDKTEEFYLQKIANYLDSGLVVDARLIVADRLREMHDGNVGYDLVKKEG